MRLELTRHNCHHPLKVARLPIPPFLQKEKEKNCFRGAQNRTRTCMPLDTRTWNVRVYHSATWALLFRATLFFCWAENETRTRDPNLGKVMLYQLSYFRIISTTVHHFPDCECKGSLFFETTKIIDYLFWKKWQISLTSQAPLRYLPTLFPIKTPCKWTFRKDFRTVSKNIFQRPKKTVVY